MRTVLFLGLLLAFLMAPASQAAAAPTGAPAKVSASAFHDAMRKLWEEHVVWTRLYIVSFAAGLPDQGPTAARLLQNQTDIGNAIMPFYGSAAGTKLTALLKAHILGAVAILKAAKAGNTAQLKTATAAWFANGDQIASFLSAANPANWPLNAVKAQMHMHLNLTIAEATARLKGNYPAGIAAYDQVENHILGLADILSSGIIRQFPSKFTH